MLKGGVVIPAGQEAMTVERSLPHGHVAAVLGTACAGYLRKKEAPPVSGGVNPALFGGGARAG